MSWLRYELTPEDAATWTATDASYARYQAVEPNGPTWTLKPRPSGPMPSGWPGGR
jgi:hypothetical protein